MKKEMTVRWRSEEAERVIDELAKGKERIKTLETENALLKVPWWCLEKAQGVIDALEKEKERNEALETENALLKKEEEKMLKWSLEEERKLVRRVIKELEIEKERTREFEQETSSGGKRRKTTVASGDATIPQLPTDVWTKIAANIDENDVAAFALTSKQLREAQQQAERELVTKPFWKDKNGKHHSSYFSRDWCIWWSRRFNMTETAPACMNRVIRVAARYGYLDVLTTYWSDIPENKKRLLMDRWTCAWAASGGHLATLQWLRSQGCTWDKHTCHWAAANGHLEVLQWARIQRCQWGTQTSSSAAANGHLEILQYLQANRCPWFVDICDGPAKNGHLSVLKSLRQMRYPMSANTTLCAAKGGHLKVFQWLRCVACPWSEEACRREGKPNIVRWMDELNAL